MLQDEGRLVKRLTVVLRIRGKGLFVFRIPGLTSCM